MNKKAAIIIILILIILGLLFLLNRFVAKQNKQESSQPAQVTVQAQVAAAPVQKPVVEEKPKETSKAHMFGKQPVRKNVFMGNRGFLIKDKISTFIKPSILAELKKNNYIKEVIEE